MVTPEECTQATLEEQKRIAHWEGIIDEKLRNEFQPGCEVHVYLDETATQRVRTALINRYSAAGWSLVYGSNQRDGSWFSIRQKFGRSDPLPLSSTRHWQGD